MTRVSVIIPNYNRSGLVNETVRNVLSQSLAPFEVIVVDDGSTDDSVELLGNEFGSEIRLIQQSNQGPGAARNAGLKIATGEFVWLMDSDDLASLNKLQTQVETLERERADLAYSPWVKVQINGTFLRPENVVLQQRPLPRDRCCLEWFLNDWSNVFQQCLIRRGLLDRTTGFRTDLHCGEDGELFVRLLLAGAKVSFDARSLTLYRLNSNHKLTADTAGDCRRHLSWAKALIEMHRSVYAARADCAKRGFFVRLQRALYDLKTCAVDHSAQITDCEEIMSSAVSRWPVYLTNVMDRYRGGISERLLGHRWGRGYQCGPLTADQLRLIEQLGYSIDSGNLAAG